MNLSKLHKAAVKTTEPIAKAVRLGAGMKTKRSRRPSPRVAAVPFAAPNPARDII